MITNRTIKYSSWNLQQNLFTHFWSPHELLFFILDIKWWTLKGRFLILKKFPILPYKYLLIIAKIYPLSGGHYILYKKHIIKKSQGKCDFNEMKYSHWNTSFKILKYFAVFWCKLNRSKDFKVSEQFF